MKVAITGHRPEKVSNWTFVEHQLALAFKDLGATTVIQGMAAGVDLTSAKVAYRNHIPFWCVKPWKGHTPRKADKENYQQALTHAEKVVDVSDTVYYPGVWIYQERNEWMVDNADVVVAVWDGTSGGTANCVRYAKKQGKKIWRIDPSTHVVGWET